MQEESNAKWRQLSLLQKQNLDRQRAVRGAEQQLEAAQDELYLEGAVLLEKEAGSDTTHDCKSCIGVEAVHEDCRGAAQTFPDRLTDVVPEAPEMSPEMRVVVEQSQLASPTDHDGSYASRVGRRRQRLRL